MPAARPEGLQRGQQQFQHFPGSAAPSQGGLSHPNAPYPIFPEGLAADQYQSRVLREAVNALPCLKFEYHWWYDRTGHNGPLPTATPAPSGGSGGAGLGTRGLSSSAGAGPLGRGGADGGLLALPPSATSTATPSSTTTGLPPDHFSSSSSSSTALGMRRPCSGPQHTDYFGPSSDTFGPLSDIPEHDEVGGAAGMNVCPFMVDEATPANGYCFGSATATNVDQSFGDPLSGGGVPTPKLGPAAAGPGGSTTALTDLKNPPALVSTVPGSCGPEKYGVPAKHSKSQEHLYHKNPIVARGEKMLIDRKLFDDLGVWQRRPGFKAMFTVSLRKKDKQKQLEADYPLLKKLKATGAMHDKLVCIGAATAYWDFCGDTDLPNALESDQVGIPSVCIPYFGTIFGLRGMKMGEILVHYILEILSKTMWSRRDHEIRYNEISTSSLRGRAGGLNARRAKRRVCEVYLPATKKAVSFWTKMGGQLIEVLAEDEEHSSSSSNGGGNPGAEGSSSGVGGGGAVAASNQVNYCAPGLELGTRGGASSSALVAGNQYQHICPGTVAEEMHCFSQSTTQLYYIDYLEVLERKRVPSLPSEAQFYQQYKTAEHFQMVRRDDACGAHLRAFLFPPAEVKQTIQGWSLLHESAQSSCNKLVEACLRKKVDPNVVDNEWRQTPLFYAANLNQAEAIRIMVKAGAKPKHPDFNGQPALFYAAKHNALDTAKLFVEEFNVDKKTKDSLKRTAYYYACQSDQNGSHAAIKEYLKFDGALAPAALEQEMMLSQQQVATAAQGQYQLAQLQHGGSASAGGGAAAGGSHAVAVRGKNGGGVVVLPVDKHLRSSQARGGAGGAPPMRGQSQRILAASKRNAAAGLPSASLLPDKGAGAGGTAKGARGGPRATSTARPAGGKAGSSGAAASSGTGNKGARPRKARAKANNG